MGTTAHAAITNLTEEQAEKLNHAKQVSIIGLSQRLGNIEATDMGDTKLGLTWIDEEEMLAIAAIVLLICLVVPVMAFKIDSKTTVIDRLQ